MKKMVIIGAASFAMITGMAAGAKPKQASAIELSSSTFKLNAHDEMIINVIAQEIHDPVENAYSFIINWVNDETETKGLNFFETHNPSTTLEYDASYIRAIKDSLYFDYFFADYLFNKKGFAVLSDFKLAVNKLKTTSNTITSLMHYLNLPAFPADTETIKTVYGYAYSSYSLLKNIASLYVYYGEPDLFEELFMLPAIGGIKNYLFNESEDVNEGHASTVNDIILAMSSRLSLYTNDDIEDILWQFECYLGQEVMFDPITTLGFDQFDVDTWVGDPTTYEDIIISMRERCYRAIIHLFMTLNSIEKMYVPGTNLNSFFLVKLMPIYDELIALIYGLSSDNYNKIYTKTISLFEMTNELALNYVSLVAGQVGEQSKIEEYMTKDEYSLALNQLNSSLQEAKAAFNDLIEGFTNGTLVDEGLTDAIESTGEMLDAISEFIGVMCVSKGFITPEFSKAMSETDALKSALVYFVEKGMNEIIRDKDYEDFETRVNSLLLSTYPLLYGQHSTALKVKEDYDDLQLIYQELYDLCYDMIVYWIDTEDQRFYDLYLRKSNEILDIYYEIEDMKNDFIQKDYILKMNDFSVVNGYLMYIDQIYLHDQSLWAEHKATIDTILGVLSAMKAEVTDSVSVLGEDERYTQLLQLLTTKLDLAHIISANLISIGNVITAVDAIKAEMIDLVENYETIKNSYKFDIEHSQDYIIQLDSIIDAVNPLIAQLLEDIIDYGEDEAFETLHNELNKLRSACDAIREDIESRIFETEVNAILNDSEGLEARVDEISNNFKENNLNYKGDIKECESLANEVDSLIARIDAKTSLSEDNRLSVLRTKLANYSETVADAQKSIEKAHTVMLALVIACPIIFVLGVLVLLYFCGFKKRFFKKAI